MMMTNEVLATGPARLDLPLYAGDGFTVGFVFVNADTGEAWPAAGAWAAQVRAPSGEVLVAFTVNTTQALEGKVTLSLTGEQTRELLGAEGATWDLQQTVTEPRTWYRGNVTTTSDVTR